MLGLGFLKVNFLKEMKWIWYFKGNDWVECHYKKKLWSFLLQDDKLGEHLSWIIGLISWFDIGQIAEELHVNLQM